MDEFQNLPGPRTEMVDPTEDDSPAGLRIVFPVRVLDAKTLKRLDDRRDERPKTLWDYEALFDTQD